MTYQELKIYDRFTVEKGQKSIFIKEENRYDGACNTYQIKNRFGEDIFEPTIFSKNYKVIKL